MHIDEACQMIRQCNEAFNQSRRPAVSSAVVAKCVQVLKTYLQLVRSDGQRIRELEIAEQLVYTAEGMRWVMPFVVTAEESFGKVEVMHAMGDRPGMGGQSPMSPQGRLNAGGK